MLDRRLIRDEPDRVMRGLEAKHVDVDFEKIRSLDQRMLELMKQSETLKHERNVQTEEIAKRKRSGVDTAHLHMKMKEYLTHLVVVLLQL